MNSETPRMAMIDPQSATGAAKDLLAKTQAQLGRTPNLYRAMANAPAALDGYLSFRNALQSGVLTKEMRERIALLTAEDNGCEYCVSAHLFRGEKIGMSQADLAGTREARSEDPRIAAGLAFVRGVMAHKGDVSDDTLAAMRAASWSDEEIGEIVAHVALNVFSNYFNHVARPELDFPLPDPSQRL